MTLILHLALNAFVAALRIVIVMIVFPILGTKHGCGSDVISGSRGFSIKQAPFFVRGSGRRSGSGGARNENGDRKVKDGFGLGSTQAREVEKSVGVSNGTHVLPRIVAEQHSQGGEGGGGDKLPIDNARDERAANK
ncbi:uncharacterized protein EI90DRAFT_3026972 [Cantharellus anzutake]|uniref:uncharacterized protein n=1 Tax=Cantharellus anzutake TaxID=1750568 RepID=UPI001904B3A6|nr:uncharacterized protein EI90DRAFT_3026972 [Cantharellus anzutake]KAF8305400.1 hypothetical protein EI90DRAFT_3026972 [Cantharellus anzutake]